MRGLKKVNESLFRAVVFCFSALMVILSLLANIRLAAASDRAAGLQKELEELKTENQILRAEYENSVSLEEIERYATQVLGLRRCAPGQVQYIETPLESAGGGR